MKDGLKKGRVKARKITQKEGVIVVTRTLKKSGEIISKKEDRQQIKIRPFVTATATMGIRYHATIPTADYANVGVDVFITYPCYVEESREVFEGICKLGQELMDDQVAKMTGKKNAE